MVKVKDIEKLMSDFMVEPNETFIAIKRYLLSEFEWNVDPLKKSQFTIRGIPIEDNRELGDILKSFLPDEVLVLRNI
ncbi:MAG: hypothetical protein ACFFEY_00480 [Candidatus Thorarchaeota archaeon]